VSKSHDKVYTYAFVGGALLIPIACVIYFWYKRAHSTDAQSQPQPPQSKPPPPPTQSQFDRLLAVAIEQEKQYKALQQQHNTLIQTLRAEEEARSKKPSSHTPPRPSVQNPLTSQRKEPLEIIDEDPNEVEEDDPPRLIFTDNFNALLTMIRPTSSTSMSIEEVEGDEEEEKEEKGFEPDNEDDKLDQELDQELNSQLVCENKEPESNPPDVSMPVPTALPAHTPAPVLIFNEHQTQAQPKPPTKRTPRARKSNKA
jgi:hypothetical protein